MAERDTSSAASLTGAVLDEEAARTAEQAARDEILFADDLLPGVGTEEMPLRDGLAKGGLLTFAVLIVLNSLDELEFAAISILGPDIATTFDVSDGTITFIGSAAVSFFILGAAPLGYLADRLRRGPIIGAASIVFAFFVWLSGMAVNAFMLFWARFGVGVAKGNTITVHPSLLADTYPIQVRGRMYATVAGAGQITRAASPILVGLIAYLAGGDDGWRWAFFVLGVPVLVAGVLAFRLPEPQRGQWEKRDVLDGDMPEIEILPISIEASARRIWRIDTVRYTTFALMAMGAALFPAASLQSFFLEEEYNLSALERGFAAAPTGVGLIFLLPWIGRRFDRTFRVDPDGALRLMGYLLLPLSVLYPLQYFMPSLALFIIVGAVNGTLLGAAFAMVQPSLQAVLPYRLRGMGSTVLSFYLFTVGGLVGSLAAAFLQDTFSERVAVVVMFVLLMPLGGFYVLTGAKRMRHDMSLVVAELQEEQDEARRQATIDSADVPAVQISGVDFSYGPVQVLFDVGFEVRKGESLALLGTNGAGKSTILSVIAGLATPERGVVRLDGKTATFTTPEARAKLGIQLLPGGSGIFPNLTIRDNLTVGAFQYRGDASDMRRRIDRALELFPVLAGRLDDRAGDLSGGQQQMLALARVMLHDPEVLIIDELSLGLAPTVVEELLVVIDALRDAGQTMIIVEQSLNVALAVADRAVFLEKGRVRFEGAATELAERDDLARAVFLGTEGG